MDGSETPNGETVRVEDVVARDVPRRSFVRVLGLLAGGAGIGVGACNLPLFSVNDPPQDADHMIHDTSRVGGDVIFRDEDSSTNDSR